MASTAADVLIDTIRDWGVEVIFGLPGDGVNEIMEALRKRQDSADCGRILDQALATPGPVVIEAVVDPLEPPMPASITVDQATKFAESLLRGEPNRAKIALTALADKVRELV